MCGGGHLLRRAEPSRSFSLIAWGASSGQRTFQETIVALALNFASLAPIIGTLIPKNQWQDSGSDSSWTWRTVCRGLDWLRPSHYRRILSAPELCSITCHNDSRRGPSSVLLEGCF